VRARVCAISREAALLVVCARVSGLGRQVTRPGVVRGSRYRHEPMCCILPAQEPAFILLYAPSLDLSTAGTRVGLEALAPKLPSSRTLETARTLRTVTSCLFTILSGRLHIGASALVSGCASHYGWRLADVDRRCWCVSHDDLLAMCYWRISPAMLGIVAAS
jgi:hypothetical protein